MEATNNTSSPVQPTTPAGSVLNKTEHVNLLPIGTKLKVTKGCPTIGWTKGTVVWVEAIFTLKDGTLLTRFNTPNGPRSLYPSNCNARGLKLLSFHNGNPGRSVKFSRVWLEISNKVVDRRVAPP